MVIGASTGRTEVAEYYVVMLNDRSTANYDVSVYI